MPGLSGAKLRYKVTSCADGLAVDKEGRVYNAGCNGIQVYMGADGRQFVTAVATGGSLPGSDVTNDEIIAFALPKQ